MLIKITVYFDFYIEQIMYIKSSGVFICTYINVYVIFLPIVMFPYYNLLMLTCAGQIITTENSTSLLCKYMWFMMKYNSLLNIEQTRKKNILKYSRAEIDIWEVYYIVIFLVSCLQTRQALQDQQPSKLQIVDFINRLTKPKSQ